jgi:8-oxo-dGTP diphosphatase
MEGGIRLRACVLVLSQGKILLVPHYNTSSGPVQWVIPGGGVNFGERLEGAAEREFEEETGLKVQITGLFDVSQVIKPEDGWHNVTITFTGEVIGGDLAPEAGHRFGEKIPKWLSEDEIQGLNVHPRETIEKVVTKLRK